MTDAVRHRGQEQTVDARLLLRQQEAVLTLGPSDLIARHVRDAREQLDAARERLRAARRRVVELEDVVTSWERLRTEALRNERAAIARPTRSEAGRSQRSS